MSINGGGKLLSQSLDDVAAVSSPQMASRPKVLGKKETDRSAKIAILTVRLFDNYGGILQAFALNKYLRSLGYEVETIRLLKPKTTFLKIIKRIVKRLVLGSGDKKVADVENILPLIAQFANKHIRFAPVAIYSDKQFETFELWQEYDAFIVGSDQVWRRGYMEYALKHMFLDFAGQKPKVSYGASFGVATLDKYSRKDKDKAKFLLSQFESISVREEAGRDICKNYFGVDAQVVIDPTLLLRKECYETLTDKTINVDIMVYILDNHAGFTKFAKDYAFKRGMSIKLSTAFSSYAWMDDCYKACSVEEWLGAFSSAKMVFTDSFHGTVFSLIFNKPFVVFENPKRGNARIDSLLDRVNLKDRIVRQPVEILSVMRKKIDWDSVNGQIYQMRVEAMHFLQKSLPPIGN